ncbi:hypothetical protein [Paenibacillus sp. FSL H8-0537]|uniref:hypothetical protein n=1 Tax=Paenibacillus sp. FSL H8-0537 TaxID=2921399 RepID=UPI0031013030
MYEDTKVDLVDTARRTQLGGRNSEDTAAAISTKSLVLAQAADSGAANALPIVILRGL